MANQNLAAIDLLPEARRALLSALKQAGRAILADAFTLPFPDKTFDLVYGWEVLHHIVDPTVVVAEMARYGLEGRHLRAFRNAAERETGGGGFLLGTLAENPPDDSAPD